MLTTWHCQEITGLKYNKVFFSTLLLLLLSSGEELGAKTILPQSEINMRDESGQSAERYTKLPPQLINFEMYREI